MKGTRVHDAKTLAVEEKDAGTRIDAYLAFVLMDEYSRSQIKRMIKEGLVVLNDRKVSPHYEVKEGDVISMAPYEVKSESMQAEDIPLNIIYEDDQCLVINKPPGMVAHPGPGNPNHTIANALMSYVQGIENVGDENRPGIVHRLDKETSGIIVAAKTELMHRHISAQFKNRTVKKIYRAIVRGVMEHDEGVIDEPVGRAFMSKKKNRVEPAGGKTAVTHYKVLKRFTNATYVECYPKTGRTHQIRVHLSYLGHPIYGDTLYGCASEKIDRHALHAYSIDFKQPVLDKRVVVECPVPDDMLKLLELLN